MKAEPYTKFTRQDKCDNFWPLSFVHYDFCDVSKDNIRRYSWHVWCKSDLAGSERDPGSIWPHISNIHVELSWPNSPACVVFPEDKQAFSLLNVMCSQVRWQNKEENPKYSRQKSWKEKPRWKNNWTNTKDKLFFLFIFFPKDELLYIL